MNLFPPRPERVPTANILPAASEILRRNRLPRRPTDSTVFIRMPGAFFRKSITLEASNLRFITGDRNPLRSRTKQVCPLSTVTETSPRLSRVTWYTGPWAGRTLAPPTATNYAHLFAPLLRPAPARWKLPNRSDTRVRSISFFEKDTASWTRDANSLTLFLRFPVQ